MNSLDHATNDGSLTNGEASLTRTRWSALITGLVYPLFGAAYQWLLHGQAYDPVAQRVAVSLLCFAYVAVTFVRRTSENVLSGLVVILTLAITGHIFFLVAMNDIVVSYVLGAYCAMFGTGIVLLRPRQLLIYYVVVAAIAGGLWWSHRDTNSFFLFLGAVAAMSVSFASSSIVLSLLAAIERSRASLARTSVALARANESLGTILGSLGQGLFTIGTDGICGGTYSEACLRLLGAAPAGRLARDVFAPADASSDAPVEDVSGWLELAFACPPDVRAAVLSLGPGRLDRPGGQIVTFEYHPVCSADDRLLEIVVVATDRTVELRSVEAARNEAARLKMIATIVEQRALFTPFLRDAIAQLRAYAHAEPSRTLASNFRGFLHTMKGGFGTFAIDTLARSIHALENEWTTIAEADADHIVRDQSGRLAENVHALERELKGILGHAIVNEQRTVEVPLDRLLELIDRTPSTLGVRADLVALSHQPIGAFFKPYESLVYRLAEQKQRDVAAFTVTGADLTLYPEPYHDVFAAFVHVFRNAVDHGFESAAERVASGKPAGTSVEVRFELSADQRLIITVTDDGRGIDRARLRESLVAKGLANRYADEAILLDAIFEADLTTRAEVTELSGRGVGLNALKIAVEQLGGSVGALARPGGGTRIRVELPLVREAPPKIRSAA